MGKTVRTEILWGVLLASALNKKDADKTEVGIARNKFKEMQEKLPDWSTARKALLEENGGNYDALPYKNPLTDLIGDIPSGEDGLKKMFGFYAPNAQLARTNLNGINFNAYSDKHRITTDFTGSDLTQADLSQSRLFIGQFGGANLTGTRFNDAFLNASDFTDATIKGGDWQGAGLGYTHFTNATIEGVNWQGADMQRANFTDATIEGVNWQGANLESANFTDATIKRVDWQGADLQRANFTDATIKRVDWQGADLQRANFTDATIEGVDWKSAKSIVYADFRGAKFDENTNWTDIDVKGAKFDVSILLNPSFQKAKNHEKAEFYVNKTRPVIELGINADSGPHPKDETNFLMDMFHTSSMVNFWRIRSEYPIKFSETDVWKELRPQQQLPAPDFGAPLKPF